MGGFCRAKGNQDYKRCKKRGTGQKKVKVEASITLEPDANAPANIYFMGGVISLSWISSPANPLNTLDYTDCNGKTESFHTPQSLGDQTSGTYSLNLMLPLAKGCFELKDANGDVYAKSSEFKVVAPQPK